MDQQERAARIASIIARLPQWIRHDLALTDAALRLRAEESLAAMLAAALAPAAGEDGAAKP